MVGGIQFRGADAPAGGLPAFGAWVRAPGPDLLLTHLWIRAGQGGAGRHGANGLAGVPPAVAPAEGDVQRVAEEDFRHQCTRVDANVVRGGAGGTNTCRGTEVSGGVGGSADCPDPYGTEASGSAGRSGGTGVPGGMGGTGAYDSHGPGTVGCDTPRLCCGVFEVLPEYELAGTAGTGERHGGRGRSGLPRSAGRADGETWARRRPRRDSGGPGGAGGGGAGGGPQMDWYEEECPWPDGLGAGAAVAVGRLRGEPGTQGESGAPSVGIVIEFGSATGGAFVPRFESVQVVAGTGRNGGGAAAAVTGLGGWAPRRSRSREELEDCWRRPCPAAGEGRQRWSGGRCGRRLRRLVGRRLGAARLADPGSRRRCAGAVLVPGRGGAGGAGGAGRCPAATGEWGGARCHRRVGRARRTALRLAALAQGYVAPYCCWPAATARTSPAGPRRSATGSTATATVLSTRGSSGGRRVLTIDNCGGCGVSCAETFPTASETACRDDGDGFRCVLVSCPPGLRPGGAGVCVPDVDALCQPCELDAD